MIFNPRARILDKVQILPDLIHLTFSGENIASHALPGNFVQVKVRNGLDPIFRRPMSIHNAEKGRFEMIFRTVGKGTALLAQAEAGDEFDIIGPLGNRFEIPAPDEKAIMIAGGVGFPPLHFFSKYLLEQKGFPIDRIVFLLGMKNKGELAMAEDVLKLGVDVQIASDDGSYGFAGFVTALFEKLFAENLRKEKIRIYACGPNPMLQRLSQIALGFKLRCQLSLEGAMPCGVGTCLGCAVKMRGLNDYLRVCQEGPVFNAEEVEL